MLYGAILTIMLKLQAYNRSLYTVGLFRCKIYKAYTIVKKATLLKDVVSQLRELAEDNQYVQNMVDAIEKSERGIAR